MRPTYSEGVRRLLANAQSEAARYRHRFVHTEHLLLGMLSERSSATGILKTLNTDRASVRRECEKHCHKGNHEMQEILKLTPRVQHIMAVAGEQMQALGHSELDTRHVLLGMLLEEEGIGGVLLRDAGVTVESVLAEMQKPQPTESLPDYEASGRASRTRRYKEKRPLWRRFLGA